MLRTFARSATWTLIFTLAVFMGTAVAFGRAHPVWDIVCITGQALEADGAGASWPTTCDQDGWKP